MKDSAIQWTDHTFNPWEGCTKVAPECKNCYAETLVDHRFGRAKWGRGQPRRRTSETLWKQPLRWNESGIFELREGPRRQRVFCLSLGDWLDEEVPIEWFVDLLALIRRCGNLDWQLLTKRPQNWESRLVQAMKWNENHDGNVKDHAWMLSWATGVPRDNIWIGVSAGADQKAALTIPAEIHFLSCEPMLHELDTTHSAVFDWIIFGGESGKNARPCCVDWICKGIEFCRRFGIAAFVKQLGSRPLENTLLVDRWPGGVRFDTFTEPPMLRVGLKDSHGGDMSEWPEDLRVREFPKV